VSNRNDDLPAAPPDRMNLKIMLLIALVGAALALVGWYRYFSA
jgi:hypothetical protein